MRFGCCYIYSISNKMEKFFSVQQIHTHCESSHSIKLVSGPPSCGKTSLLFQFAFNLGLEGNVTFICNRRKLENKPPYLSQGVDPTSETFQRIQMKYLEDDDGIKKYFSAFHLHSTLPVAVVIDDFGDFFEERRCQEKYANPRGRDLAMVRTLALCQNAVSLANQCRPCQLVLSDTHHGESPRLIFIYKRWVPTIFTIRGDGAGWFILRSINNCGIDCCLRTKRAKYSIALQFLSLEEISEDSREQ
ncbi:uncharacterized protein LOC101205665 [Cucumis sativus]|nr:uncharacterized protein LOC101205665 [Cucumis sativus]KAE8646754.1 hypothetical protein Csa_004885 [Cucumis sativus]